MQGLLFDGAVKQPMYGKDDEVPVPRNNSSTSAGGPSADGIGDTELIKVDARTNRKDIDQHKTYLQQILTNYPQIQKWHKCAEQLSERPAF